MKTIVRPAIIALAAAMLLSPVARAADVPAADSKGKPAVTQAEKATPKRAAARPAVDVSRQQYLDQAGKRFDAIDGNRDGKLTADERRSYAQKMRTQRQNAPARGETKKQ